MTRRFCEQNVGEQNAYYCSKCSTLSNNEHFAHLSWRQTVVGIMEPFKSI